MTVFDTAKYILEKKGCLSTMKLQKLCYYAQAWSLVWDDAPLFDDDFEAWANGPVCPTLFRATQGNYSVTAKDEKGLAVLRHTASHVLAQAVKRLYPEAKLAIGPAIEEGFYMILIWHHLQEKI